MNCLFSPVPVAECELRQSSQGTVQVVGETWASPALAPLAIAVILMALALWVGRRRRLHWPPPRNHH